MSSQALARPPQGSSGVVGIAGGSELSTESIDLPYTVGVDAESSLDGDACSHSANDAMKTAGFFRKRFRQSKLQK